jgi:uncharacterized protein YegP (UPF0339 family)
MTEDRRQHPRERTGWLDGEAGGDRRQPNRDPAEMHFRRLGEPASDALETERPSGGADPCRFEVYRSDEVSTNSTQFVGGDWHWRLCDAAGGVLVDAGGYRDAHACRDAVAILQARAADAAVTPGA